MNLPSDNACLHTTTTFAMWSAVYHSTNRYAENTSAAPSYLISCISLPTTDPLPKAYGNTRSRLLTRSGALSRHCTELTTDILMFFFLYSVLCSGWLGALSCATCCEWGRSRKRVGLVGVVPAKWRARGCYVNVVL